MSDAELPDPPSDEEIEARLGSLREKLDESRNKAETKPKHDLDPETSRGMGLGLAAAYAIMGLPFLGALLGWLADRAAGTQPLFIMLGVLLGGMLGIAHAVRLSNRQK